MSRFNLLTKLVVIFILLLVFAAYFPHHTKSTEVGVRVIKWSPFRS